MDEINPTPKAAARRLAEALGALFAEYPVSPDGADTLTLTITGHGGAPLQVDGDPGQFGWIADLVERAHADADASHPGADEEAEEDNPFAPDPSLLH